MKIYIVTPQQNCLGEMVIISGHNICFSAKIRKIIPKLSVTLLIWSTETCKFNFTKYLEDKAKLIMNMNMLFNVSKENMDPGENELIHLRKSLQFQPLKIKPMWRSRYKA